MTTLRRYVPAVVLAVAVAVAPSTRAAEPGTTTDQVSARREADPGTTDYVTAKFGTYLPQSSKMSGYDAGLDGEVTIGRFFLDFLAAELGVGYVRASAPMVFGSYPQMNGGWTWVQRSESLQVIPVTVGVRAVLPIGSIRPYVVGGAGLYFTRLELDQAGMPAAGTATSASDSKTLFGVHVGVGATVQLGQRAFAGVEGRFTSSRATFFGMDDRNIDAIRVSALAGLQL